MSWGQFGNNFGSYGNFGNYGGYMQQPQPQPQPSMQMQQAVPVKTNKIFITSIEDAMARYVEPNSEIVYLHQDKPILVEVKTDMQGRKTCNVFDLSVHSEDKKEDKDISAAVASAGFCTKKDVEEIVRTEIEKAIERKKKNTKLESKIEGELNNG